MSNNRQIVRNLVFNVGTFIINLGISFLLTPYLIKTVGKEAYGFFPLVNEMLNYTTIVTTAVGSMAGRFITMEIYGGNEKTAQYYFNSILLAQWVLSLFIGLVFLAFSFNVCDILSVPGYLTSDIQLLIAFAGIAFCISLSTSLFGVGTYIKNRLDVSSAISLAYGFVRVLAIILLFYLFLPNIYYVSLAAVFASIVSGVLNIWQRKKLLPEIIVSPFKYFSWNKFKDVTSAGLWNSLNQLSNVLLSHLDLLIANIFISVAATGDYALVKTMPNLIFGLLAALSSSFTPHFNILYAKKEKKLLINEFNKSVKIVGILIGVPIGFLLIFSDVFFSLWVPSEDSSYLGALSIITLLPMVIGGSINPIFGIFGITNKLKIPSIVLLSAGIVNTLAIFILLRTTNLGLWSIPIVGAIQQGVRNVFFSPIYGAYCLGEKMFVFYPAIFQSIAGMTVVVLVSMLVRYFIEPTGWLAFIIAATLVTLISLMANMLLIFNKSERVYLFDKVLKVIKRISKE